MTMVGGKYLVSTLTGVMDDPTVQIQVKDPINIPGISTGQSGH